MGKKNKSERLNRDKWKTLANYLATFLSNLAVIGMGLGLFQNAEGTMNASIGALLLGAFILWRVEK